MLSRCPQRDDCAEEIESIRAQARAPFTALIESRPCYSQLRFIDLHGDGPELIRLDHRAESVPAQWAGRDGLQPKGTRD